MKTLPMCLNTLMAIAVLSMAPAHAGKGAPPSAAYQGECGSCHAPFPPGMMSAPDWNRVMASLGKHYGDNATLDAQTVKTLESYLVTNAGRQPGGQEAGALPRITTGRLFVREHHEVPQAIWQDPAIGSRANCGACHSRAASGSFREREIRMPGGRRWEE